MDGAVLQALHQPFMVVTLTPIPRQCAALCEQHCGASANHTACHSCHRAMPHANHSNRPPSKIILHPLSSSSSSASSSASCSSADSAAAAQAAAEAEPAVETEPAAETEPAVAACRALPKGCRGCAAPPRSLARGRPPPRSAKLPPPAGQVWRTASLRG